jgi:exonuclease III
MCAAVIAVMCVVSVNANECMNGCSRQDSGFKVMNYNIWNGFDWGKSEQKRQLFVDFIKSESPDILAMQELCAFNHFKLKKLAKDYGHKYSVILKSTGYPVGISSKYPITNVKRKQLGFWHGVLLCNVKGINIAVVHLSPAYYSYRLKEAGVIASMVADSLSSGEKWIVMGDFNAHSSNDAAQLALFPQKLENQRKGEDGKSQDKTNLKDGEYDFSVMDTFFKAGLKDSALVPGAVLEGKWTFPGNALIADEKAVVEGYERIDFQLVSENLFNSIKSYDIIKNEYTMQISDHYPVCVVYNNL